MTSFFSFELGRHQIKILLLDREAGSLVIRAEKICVFPPTEPPEEDLKSRIREALHQFRKDHPQAGRKAYLVISDPSVINIKNAVLPAMPAKELVSAISWQAKEDGLLAGDNDLCNYDVVKEFSDEEDAKKCAVVFSIVNRKLLRDYVLLFTRAGFDVLHVSAAPLSNAKVLPGPEHGKGPQAVLNLGYGDSTLSIYIKGKLTLIRTLSFSYSKVKAGLNDPLFLGTQFQTPEADPAIESAILSDAEAQPANFQNLVRPVLEGLVREIRYSFTYFMTNLNEEKPAELFLTGHGVKFKALKPFLETDLGLTVHNLLLPPAIKCKEEVAGWDPVRLSPCVAGIAGTITGHDSVDFLPLEFKTKRFESFQRKVLLISTLAVAGILGLAFFFTKLETNHCKRQSRIIEQSLRTFGKFAELSSKAFPRFFLTHEISREVVPAEKALKLVAYLLPPRIVLKKFILDAAERQMTLEVVAELPETEQKSAVGEFVSRLKETSFFSNVTAEPVTDIAGTRFLVEGVFKNA